jgi:DNA-binding GntR family transcriptional regulator
VSGVTPIDRSSRLVHHVTERLRDMILDGSVAPGTELRQERLAAELGVSRTPLREAFHELERDGLVDSINNNRSVVVELDDRNVRELLEIREVVDGLAARLAAERPRDAPRIAELREAAERLEEASTAMDMGAFLSNHLRFHTAVFAASANARLDTFLPTVRISSQMWYSRLGSRPNRVEESAHEHRAIVEAIVEGDAASAERLAREHIRASLTTWASEVPS